MTGAVIDNEDRDDEDEIDEVADSSDSDCSSLPLVNFCNKAAENTKIKEQEVIFQGMHSAMVNC